MSQVAALRTWTPLRWVRAETRWSCRPSQSIPSKNAKGALPIRAINPPHAPYLLSSLVTRHPSLLLLVPALAQLGQVAPHDDPGVSAVGVDDRLDAGGRALAVEVAHGLHAVDLAAGREVFIDLLERI